MDDSCQLHAALRCVVSRSHSGSIPTPLALVSAHSYWHVIERHKTILFQRDFMIL